ncbi:MAG: hypothetical protein JWN73_1956 [Betaproteobacteria bacterium]|nr:hypothetical protein [Betaproteobacteria bacterium]
MNLSIFKAGALALLLLASPAYANGEIEFMSGDVSVMNAKGELRVPARGQRVEPGDTVMTGRDGEVHLVMDDNGLIALRPGTRLKIEVYTAAGTADDGVVLNLFRGTFRSVTGWIGKTAPSKYSIRTPSATIGIRGTDHEPMVIDEGPDAGTYDKVNEGGSTLTTGFGKVDVAPQQAGFAPRGALVAPQVLAVVPPLFKTTPNENVIERSKASLAKGIEEQLLKKRRENERGGAGPALPLAATQAPVKLGDANDMRNASLALDELLAAYEQGNVGYLRAHLNPAMIGLQKLLDDVTKENNLCKQMRVLLLDKQVQASPDLAVIQTNFQKRCLQLPNMTPVFFSGHTTFLMHREPGGWTMAAVSGVSPFNSALTNVLATMTVVNGAVSPGFGGPAAPAPQPFRITVVDPDRAGMNSVTVQINTTHPFINDSLTVTLLPVSPGSPQFSVATVLFANPPSGRCIAPSAPANQPTALEVCPGTSYVVNYVDTTTPNGGQVVSSRGVIP